MVSSTCWQWPLRWQPLDHYPAKTMCWETISPPPYKVEIIQPANFVVWLYGAAEQTAIGNTFTVCMMWQRQYKMGWLAGEELAACSYGYSCVGQSQSHKLEGKATYSASIYFESSSVLPINDTAIMKIYQCAKPKWTLKLISFPKVIWKFVLETNLTKFEFNGKTAS